MKVYLSGGFHSGWQDKFISGCPDVEFLDPRTHGLVDEKAYTQWDCDAIDRCDLVIAYAEASNPSLLGLAYEVGYAKARGKRIWLIQDTDDKRLGMCRASADFVFDLREYNMVMPINELKWMNTHA